MSKICAALPCSICPVIRFYPAPCQAVRCHVGGDIKATEGARLVGENAPEHWPPSDNPIQLSASRHGNASGSVGLVAADFR
jgi:hypothetical protein